MATYIYLFYPNYLFVVLFDLFVSILSLFALLCFVFVSLLFVYLVSVVRSKIGIVCRD